MKVKWIQLTQEKEEEEKGKSRWAEENK